MINSKEMRVLMWIAVAITLWPAWALRAESRNKEFRWVDFKKDKEIVSKIEAALADVSYTQIREIGVIDKSVLIIASKRPDDLSDNGFYTDFDEYSAYSLQLDDGNPPQAIWHGYKMRLLGEVKFTKSILPDMVFRFENCVECEPDTFLGSFYFDTTKKSWSLRKWGDEKDGILIDISMYEEPWTGSFVYSVHDYNGDKLDDAAVWFHEINPETKKTTDAVILYTVQDDKPREIEIKSAAEKKRIKQAICRSVTNISNGWLNPMCKSFQK